MAAELLARVGIPDAEQRVNQYPFEFSGGMRQRAMIAMAISCNPDILIADEPTTALDVTIQAQIIDVVREMQAQLRLGRHPHHPRPRRRRRDRRQGHGHVRRPHRRVRAASTRSSTTPHHPYTWGLLGSLPRLDETEKTRLTPIKGQPPNLIAAARGLPVRRRAARYERDECRDNWPRARDRRARARRALLDPARRARGASAPTLPHFKETAA